MLTGRPLAFTPPKMRMGINKKRRDPDSLGKKIETRTKSRKYMVVELCCLEHFYTIYSKQ